MERRVNGTEQTRTERRKDRKRKREGEARETRQRVRPPSRLHTTSSIPSLHTQLQLHHGRGSLVCTCEAVRASLSHNRESLARVRTYIYNIHIYIIYIHISWRAQQRRRRAVLTTPFPSRVRSSRVEIVRRTTWFSPSSFLTQVQLQLDFWRSSRSAITRFCRKSHYETSATSQCSRRREFVIARVPEGREPISIPSRASATFIRDRVTAASEVHELDIDELSNANSWDEVDPRPRLVCISDATFIFSLISDWRIDEHHRHACRRVLSGSEQNRTNSLEQFGIVRRQVRVCRFWKAGTYQRSAVRSTRAGLFPAFPRRAAAGAEHVRIARREECTIDRVPLGRNLGKRVSLARYSAGRQEETWHFANVNRGRAGVTSA